MNKVYLFGIFFMRLLYLVACIEGFSTLAVEIIALRLAAPIVGSSSIVTSVFLGIILLALSAGYRHGGILASSLSKDKIKQLIALYLLLAALFYLLVSFAFEQSLLERGLAVSGNYLVTLFFVAIVLFFLPVYLASQTVPLLTELIDETSKGKAAGKMLFASTVGSFFGSVLTSIVFFQYLGVHLTSVLVTLLLLVITGIWMQKTSKKIAFMIYILAGMILLFSFFGKQSPQELVYGFDSAYQEIRIVDGYAKDDRPIRVYKTNGSFASALYHDTRESPFAYIQEALTRTVELAPANVLIIGAAGFSYPYELVQRLPSIERIDVIDVDPSVKEIAETYFLEEELSKKVRFFPESARFTLNKKRASNESYDLIFVDAFQGKAIPGELTTQEFFRDLQHVSLDGIVMINMILDSELESDLAKKIFATLLSVYKNVWIAPADPSIQDKDIQNFIVATHQLTQEYSPVLGGGVVYTDDKRSTEEDVVQMYWGN